jgi:hypothetical protein
MMTWPTGDFDDLRRLRVLHAAYPGTILAETVLAAPFDDVWSVINDVEREFPGLVPDVRSIRITGRDGEHMTAMVYGRSGLRAPFEMVLRPGWCLMQSRFLRFAMAAAPAPQGTRFAYLAGLRLPGTRTLAPLLSPVRRRLGRATLRRFEHRFGSVGR